MRKTPRKTGAFFVARHCEKRSDEAIHFSATMDCFADLSSGAHSRDPLARNDGLAI
jgi:hypothetical protein